MVVFFLEIRRTALVQKSTIALFVSENMWFLCSILPSCNHDLHVLQLIATSSLCHSEFFKTHVLPSSHRCVKFDVLSLCYTGR
jgi:hypothetical protein